MKRHIILFSTIALLITGCTSSADDIGSEDRSSRSWNRPEQEAQERALSVRAYAVGRRPISTYIVANTTLEAIRDVTIYSRLNAIISELPVEEGDAVHKDQVVARLDDREILNELSQAEIAVEQAEVSVNQAEVRSELSKASYQRALSLFEQKLTSREEFDQAGLNNRTDALALENARRQLEATKARLEAVRIQLDYTTVVSPIDGVITERLQDVGDRVNASEAIFNVLEFPPLWARIFVPEKSLPQLKIGQKAELEMETYPGQRFQGQIKMISPTIDSASGTVKVTIEVNRPGNLLRPGMFGTVLIATETHENAIVVPKKAITRERDQSFIYSINEDGTVTRKEVTLGFSEEDWTEILTGISAGETIVTVGVETLSDGYPVTVQSFENMEGSVSPVSPSQNQVREQADRSTESEEWQQSQKSETSRLASGPEGRDRRAMFQRMMNDPEIKKKWEAKLKEDPSIADDPQKRRAFFREIMSQSQDRANNQ